MNWPRIKPSPPKILRRDDGWEEKPSPNKSYTQDIIMRIFASKRGVNPTPPASIGLIDYGLLFWVGVPQRDSCQIREDLFVPRREAVVEFFRKITFVKVFMVTLA